MSYYDDLQKIKAENERQQALRVGQPVFFTDEARQRFGLPMKRADIIEFTNANLCAVVEVEGQRHELSLGWIVACPS